MVLPLSDSLLYLVLWPTGVLCYLLVFSAYTNLGKILQVNPNTSPGNITCLHAMR